MANVDRPNGARPVRMLDGRKVPVANPYTVDGSASAIFPGDKVKLETDGNIDVAGAADAAIGFVAWIDGDYDNLSRAYLPASTSGTVYVYDHPDTVFAIQEDDADGNALTAAAKGANANTTTTGGSTTASRSRQELDRSTVGTETTKSLRLLDIVKAPDNEYGASAEWEVLINLHQRRQVGGV